MRRFLFLGVLGLFFIPGTIFAVQFNEITVPYENYVVTQSDIEALTLYGELNNFPDMFELNYTATTSVSFAVDALGESEQIPLFSGIIVRDEGSAGVREISRLPAHSAEWELERDPRTKMLYQRGPVAMVEFSPGTYRIEISTPDNFGKYRVLINEGSAAPKYLAAVSEIRAIQHFHGFSWWHMLRTSHVYVPMLILVILFGLGGTYYLARRHRWL